MIGRHPERVYRWLALRPALVLLVILPLLTLRITSVVANFYLPAGYDARAYVAAGRAIRAGLDPLQADPSRLLPEVGVPTGRPGLSAAPLYLYPPFLAVLLLPLAALPFASAMALWLAIVIVTSAMLIPLLRHFVGWRLAVLAVGGFAPVWQGAWLGQINAAVAVLLLALLSYGRRQSAWSGTFLALGTLLKLTPIIGLVVLLLRGERRGVVVAAAVMLGLVAATLPLVTASAWLEGVSFAARQAWATRGLLSWTALLHRALGRPGYWLGFPVAAVFAGITLVRAPAIPPLLALAAAFLLPLLVARITWEHHALMALPALAVLWTVGERGRLLAGATWLAISLVGGIAMPLGLAACWAACCWPSLLRSTDKSVAA